MLLKKQFKTLSLSLMSGICCINTVHADTTKMISEMAKDQFYLDLNGGAWMVNWDQQSTAKSQFGNDAIDTDYSIDNAPASSLRAQFGFTEFFSGKLEYAETQEKTGKKLSNLAGALGFFINDFTFFSKLYQGKFDGSLAGVKDSGGQSVYGEGTFTTKLNISDWLIFYKKFGFGYRNFQYELPQDLYLTSQSNPQNVIVSGFEEIKYSGNFLMISVDSNLGEIPQTGWNLALSGGIGELKPSGTFLNDLNANSTISAANNGKSIMSNGQAQFLEGHLAYQWIMKQQTMDWGVNLGYKYSKLTATFDNKANYSLVTDFESTLTGPYLEITGRF